MCIIDKERILNDLGNVRNSKTYETLLHSGDFEEVIEIENHKILFACYRSHYTIHNYENEYSRPDRYMSERFNGITYVATGIILDSKDKILRAVSDTYNINEKYGTTVSNTQVIVKNDKLSLKDIYGPKGLFVPYVLTGFSNLWASMAKGLKTGTYDHDFINDMSCIMSRDNICSHSLLELEMNQNNLYRQLQSNLQANSIIISSINAAASKISKSVIQGAAIIASSNRSKQ